STVESVRQQAVRENVLAAVGIRIRIDRAFEQAEPERRALDTVAMLAVRQERHAVMRIRKVGPALRGHLEGGLGPAGVVMRRPLDRSELDLVGGTPTPNRGRKRDLQQSLAFWPVDARLKVNARRARVDAQPLDDPRPLTESPAQLDDRALRT